MTDDFAQDGQLAKAIPGFKPREPQRQMAVAVTQAIEKGQPLVVEAGTGTGKTYAYLAPALRAKKKVIISTGSKALQDQLYSRDLPTVSKALKYTGNVALLKGRSNYLCLERLEQQALAGGDLPVQILSDVILPRNLPQTNQPGSARQLAAMLRPIIEANNGRCFMLCTSHAMMRDLAEQFRATMTLPVLLQGETSKGQLLQQFVSAGNALLVATSSFWEGVDVRGDTLSLVIIDKLPFTSPDDPLLKARMEDCRLRGGDPFDEVQLPDAVITLKQGVGRLIRDADDRGVLVICDNRLVMRPYGATFLASLPPAPRTRDIARAVRFLAIPSSR